MKQELQLTMPFKMNKNIAHDLIGYMGWLKTGRTGYDCGSSITLKRMMAHIEKAYPNFVSFEQCVEHMENDADYQKALNEKQIELNKIHKAEVVGKLNREINRFKGDILAEWRRQLQRQRWEKLSQCEKDRVRCAWELKHRDWLKRMNAKDEKKADHLNDLGLVKEDKYKTLEFKFQKPLKMLDTYTHYHPLLKESVQCVEVCFGCCWNEKTLDDRFEDYVINNLCEWNRKIPPKKLILIDEE